MKFKLPKLDKLVDATKITNETDAKRYIHVVDGHAIVNNGLIVCVNIREYVKRECGVDDEEDLDRLTGIVDFMNGKSFTRDYWAEMTKECFANLIGDDTIEIDFESYNKRLVYENVITEKETSLKVVADNLVRGEENVTRFAVDHRELEKISKAFAQETRNDTIIFASTGQATCLKFTFHKKDYIFGVIPTNYDKSTEMVSFLVNTDLSKEINKAIKL